MSNFVAEIMGVILSPANKLIDSVSGAIGKAYEPKHVKRMAKAKAKEIELIGQALRNNADVPIKYEKGEIIVDTTDFDEFVKRTQSRIAFQELQKQQNIEKVVDTAYGLLEGETECSEEPVDKDWLSRFFNSVENISDSDMQILWAKILAGEVKQPKTYSLRTLETLKNLSKDEALLFQKVAPYVFCGETNKYITSNANLLVKYGINYDDIILLNECGLLTLTSSMGISMNLRKGQDPKEIIYNEKIALIFDGKNDEDSEIIIRVHKLTTTGKELFDVVKKEPNEEYILDLAETIYIKNKRNINIRVCKVKCIEKDIVKYEEIPIKEFNE